MLLFDHVSDLHLDNAMAGGPHGTFKNVNLARYRTEGATHLIVAGDTANHIGDTIDVINAVAPLYERVILAKGNHEQEGPHLPVASNVILLDEIRFAVHRRVGFVGGCLDTEEAVAEAVRGITFLDSSTAVDRIIIVSHFVPSPRLSKLFGRDVASKSNDLLDRLGPLSKRTDVVFGHVHLACDGYIDGVRVRANPRGYRGQLRDRTHWRGRFASFT